MKSTHTEPTASHLRASPLSGSLLSNSNKDEQAANVPSKLGRDAFAELYTLMENAFPANERRSLDDQYALLSIPFYSLRVKRTLKGQLLGLLAIWDLGSFVFVEHIAVSEEARGQGLGAQMMRELLNECEAKPVILEVEPPETPLAQRRIGFYERLGLHLNLFDYEQPSLQKEEPPVRLLIMSSNAKLSADEFNQYRDQLMDRVYKCGNE